MRLIRIIHRLGQYMEFLFLSEFFRFAGIYVQEHQVLAGESGWGKRGIEYQTIDKQEGQVLERRRYDATLWILARISEGEKEKEEEERQYALDCGYFPVEAFSTEKIPKDKDEWKKFLLSALDSMEQRGLFAADIEELKGLCTICCRFDLMRHAYSVRYFAISRFQGEYYNYFKRGYEELEKVRREKRLGERGYAVYAQMNCARRVNEACEGLGQIREYDSRRLMNSLQEIAKLHHGWHAPYLLAAFIAERDFDSRNKVWYYYQCAAGLEDRWDSYLYYYMGKFWEKEDQKRAMEYYQLAYRIDPGNYRAVYKIAFLNEFIKKYETAWEQYYWIIERFYRIEEGGIQQPMDIEYMLKAYLRLMRIARVKLDRRLAASAMADDVNEYVDRLGDNRFFENFYLKDGAKKREAMNQRIPVEMIRNEKRELDAIKRAYMVTA